MAVPCWFNIRIEEAPVDVIPTFTGHRASFFRMASSL